ncbi:acetyltransferase [Corynebacterium sp. H127]|uniref:acetyltransferase n=1 Tax=Corynebacterium sp. H127 TaxID=3133418 RepID=UPI0030A916F4
MMDTLQCHGLENRILMNSSQQDPIDVVVVGASGFGRECLDVLDAMALHGHHVEVVGVIDDAPSEENLSRLNARNVRYLGKVEHWIRNAPREVQFVIGIGNPSVRARLAQIFESFGHIPFTAIHPSAVLGKNTEPMAGTVICANATVSTNVQFGRYVHVNPSATIGHDSILHDFVSINPAAVISGDVEVGARTLVGASATILQGLKVGENSLVGACACVTKDFEDSVVVKGIPARSS